MIDMAARSDKGINKGIDNGYQKSLNFGLDSGSTWLDGVNGILMQQEPNSPKQDYWNRGLLLPLPTP
jgi:hypothetical protein